MKPAGTTTNNAAKTRFWARETGLIEYLLPGHYRYRNEKTRRIELVL